MKQMKNGVAIGAVALFALTGCVENLAYVPPDSGEQPCVQGPCEEVAVEQQAAQQVAAPVAAEAPQQVAAPVAAAPVQMVAPVASAPMAVQQDLGEGLPTNVQPGECYSPVLLLQFLKT